jgi:Putative zinc dependent peptidase (DUF5700)
MVEAHDRIPRRVGPWLLVLPLIATLGVACSREERPRPSIASHIRLEFDYSAAERMIEAVDRKALSEAEAAALLENRGIAAMVKKTGVFSPGSTPKGFVADMQTFVATKRYPKGDFALDWIYKERGKVRKLVCGLRENEEAMRGRMAERLLPYAPRTGPITIKVHFVAGGMSDGFVLDDDSELALFVALDKAQGDRDGVEQNLTHEIYHALQKASIAKTPRAVSFAATVSSQPALQQLLATTLWEGTANLAADARETRGHGSYASMWRKRYVRNLKPERRRENFQLFDSVLAGLDQGKIDWDSAYRTGFTGEDSRFYFVGMEMAGALASARGKPYFEELFVRPPTQFFRDYFTLYDADSSLVRFSAETRHVIENLPASW